MTSNLRSAWARVLAVLIGVASALPAAGLQAPPPPAPSAQEKAAMTVQQTGDWTKTLQAFTDLAKTEPGNPRAIFGLGAALHETGRPGEAIPLFDQARTMGYQPVNQVRFRLARAYAKLGDTSKALSGLEELAAQGFTNLPVMQNPDFASLKGDPRFEAVVTKVGHNARPCDADPNFRKFDFWVGDWDVQQTGVPRAPVGASSHVERILSGCVIFENWEPGPGGAGKSFNTYNTTTRKWEQYWVDATGRITHYFGEFKDDGNLYYEADQFGTSSKVRMTFFNQGADQVRQLGHISNDGGTTWSVSFDLTYIRKK